MAYNSTNNLPGMSYDEYKRAMDRKRAKEGKRNDDLPEAFLKLFEKNNVQVPSSVKRPVYPEEAEIEEVYEEEEILAEEADSMAEVYRELAALAVEIMRNHAPKAVAGEIEAVVRSVLFHRTVGLMGRMAVDSGGLHLPDAEDNLPAAIFLYNTDEERSADLRGDCSD